MKTLKLLIIFCIGCSSAETTITSNQNINDAGVCEMDGSLNYAADSRYRCYYCDCAGQKCDNIDDFSDQVFTGICDEKLTCSEVCPSTILQELMDAGL